MVIFSIVLLVLRAVRFFFLLRILLLKKDSTQSEVFRGTGFAQESGGQVNLQRLQY